MKNILILKTILLKGKLIFSETCCSNNCHLKIVEDDQKHLSEKFWCLTNYNKQNLYLFGLMNLKKIRWNYHVDINGFKTNVCKKLFITIFQVTKRKLEILKEKMITGQSLDDGRGHHTNHYQITDETWKLLSEFINQIPKKNSHYSLEKTNKKFFDDSSITMAPLYNNF